MTLPVIGITTMIEPDGDLHLRPSYINAIADLGGTPILLAKNENDHAIKEQISRIDGLYLTGGTDINPSTYGEEPHPKLGVVEIGRDEYEIKLIKHALERGVPIIGICRGSQLLNSINGGTMYQSLEDQYEGELLQHMQNSARDYLQHTIHVEPDTKFHKIVGVDKFQVNSFHHQANHKLADEFVLAASAPDGVVEAIEFKTDQFVLGLQFHPEDTYKISEPHRKILEAFIQAAKDYSIK